MFSEILRDPNIIDSYKRKIQAAKEEDIGIELIAERASKGEPVAMQIVEEYCSLLNILSITIVNMLNPEMIIIGGKLAQCYPKIAEILQQKLHQDLLLVPAEAVKVRTAKHGVTGGIFGAVGLVLYELFEPLHSLSLRATQKKQAAKPRVIDVE
jgi:predicted NBD/HSP70 family sugar kinase